MSFSRHTIRVLSLVADMMQNHGLTDSTVNTVMENSIDRLLSEEIQEATYRLQNRADTLKSQLCRVDGYASV